MNGRSGEKLEKLNAELQELNEQRQKFEENKLDTMIVCSQHKKYMAHEQLRFQQFMTQLDNLVDDGTYWQLVGQEREIWGRCNMGRTFS